MTYGLRDLDGQVIEVCDECGFDARFVADAASSFDAGFRELHALVQRPHATVRPGIDVWSATEYAHHVVWGSKKVGDLVHGALGQSAPFVATDLSTARSACVQLATSISDAERHVSCPFEGAPTDAGGLVLHLLHDLEHHVLDVRRGYAKLALEASAAVFPLDT